MRISIITVSLNSSSSIRHTIESVKGQLYKDIELIIIDGNSSDNTIGIVREYELVFGERLKWVCEKDTGIYNAMNKGLKLATGEVVGFLNSDDYYYSTTSLNYISDAFLKEPDVSIVFGDVIYVSSSQKSIRKYSGRSFKPWMFRWGFMPPHPAFYVRKNIYDKYGNYNESFDISGDFELMARLLYIERLPYRHIDNTLVSMTIGGRSTHSIRSVLINNSRNILQACRSNGIYTNYILIGIRYMIKSVSILRYNFHNLINGY